MGEDCGEVGGKDGDECVNEAHSPTILTCTNSCQHHQASSNVIKCHQMSSNVTFTFINPDVNISLILCN